MDKKAIETAEAVKRRVSTVAALANDMDVEELMGKELMKDLGFDSLDVINLLFQLEEEFGVRISEEEIDSGSLNSISGIVNYINTNTH